MAWQIFMHSIRQVINNMEAALRISIVLFAVQLVVSYALGASISGASEAEIQQRLADGQIPLLGLLLTAIVMIVTGFWIAVAWHRYVLKVEMPTSFIPPFLTDRMLSYFGKTLLLAVICIPVALVASLLIGLIVTAFTAGGSPPGIGVGILAFVVMIVPVVVVFYRLSVILPAAALGERISLTEAWSKTAGSSGTIVLLAVISVVAAVVIDLPLRVLSGVPLLALAWAAATAWLKMMVGFSILTTLYGHFVEKRPLL